MGTRLEFHEKLCALLDAKHVFFQPPASIELEYPCIIYEMTEFDPHHADNMPYILNTGYLVIYITDDPDDAMRYRLEQLPYSHLTKPYVADNLYHYPFKMYF